MNRLKQLLSQGDLAMGLWVTLESASITEIATVMGLDWICVDAEHGHMGLKEIMEHVRVTRNTDTTAIVRIEEIEEGNIKRVLDIGADGILVPQVRTADEVALAVKYAKYPPMGVRGIGAERATRWALGIKGYAATANEETMVIPLIENTDALQNFDAILNVEGVAAIFFGPHDLAASMGHIGDWGHPEVMKHIFDMRQRAGEAGMACGIVCADGDEAKTRREQGFQMLAIGIDTILMVRSVQDIMEALGRSVKKEVWDA